MLPELKSLFTTYFGEKLSPSQLDGLVVDVAASLISGRSEPNPAPGEPRNAPERGREV
ncbi:MAG: hypothetical protein HY690_17985 [Chloroflexi bacterium]|nr:hypothetical protein [Chloroflexota bacterium]